MRCVILALAASCASVPLLAQVVVPAPAGAPQAPPGVPGAAAEGSAPISAEEARQTAAEFARVLEKNFLYPDVAEKYAARLRSGAANGEYDHVGTRSALASLLTKQLQAVFPDGHLRIWPDAGAGGPQPQMVMMSPQSQQGPVKPAKTGPGQPIEEARWLAPGIAYIRFTIFPLDPAVTAAAVKFMEDHADAKTVIFDMRNNRGGGMGQAAAMLPYLFGEEAVFLSHDTRASVFQAAGGGQNMPPWMRLAPPSREGVRTEETVIKPHPSERGLFDAKVFVLTSDSTISAAEAFAFGMKSTGRGTLIGESTRGAGNYAPPGQRVNDKFGAFIPVGRAYDPKTGKGWEGTGVEPDIKVPAESALVEALVRSGVARSKAEKISASVSS